MAEFQFELIPFSAVSAAHWGELSNLNCVMQTHEWLSAAADAIAPNDAAYVVQARDASGQIVALVAFRMAGASRLVLLGALDFGESVNVAANDAAVLDGLADYLLSTGKVLDLGHYPIADGLLDRLSAQAKHRGLALKRALPSRAAPSLKLDESWVDPTVHMKKSRRKNTLRKMRKATGFGGLELKVVSPEPSEVSRYLDTIFEVEAKGWKGRSKTSLSADFEQAAFYRRYAALMAENKHLRLCFLEVNKTPAAVLIAVVWRNRFWALKTGYDEAFSEVSPGELLFFNLIKHAAEQGYETFEFCGKSAAWTDAWTKDAQDIAAFRYYPANLRGLSLLIFDSASKAFSALKRSILK